MAQQHTQVIRNVIFDFGGVLVDLDKARALEAFLAIGLDASPYIGTYSQGGPFAAIEKGDCSSEDFLDSLQCDATREEKLAAWCSLLVDVPRHRLDALLRLRGKYRLFLLSNTNELHWLDSLRRWWRCGGHHEHDYFEQIFLSYELHQCKPGTGIFKTALQLAGLQPEETLFIDDSRANCDAAASVGLHTMCATGDEWMDCVATIGHFDGVHAGHRFLIERVKDEAARRGLWSMLITFDRHPREIVDPAFVPQALTMAEEKIRLLQASGVDQVEVLHFDREMSQMPACDFLAYIKEKLGVRVLLVGHDHRFGHGRGETIEDYRRHGQEVGVEVIAVGAMPGENVSSSIIRRLLDTGDAERAAQLLGRPYSLTGTVVAGHQIGRQMGFPTANLHVTGQLIPARGVYAARWNGRSAVLNIGSRPTIDNGEVSVEMHIPGFSGDLYGQSLTVQLLRRLRAERHFDTIEDLRRQIARDVDSVM